MTPTLHIPDFSEYQLLLSPAEWRDVFAHQAAISAGESGLAIIRIDYGSFHPDAHRANRINAWRAGAKAIGLYQYAVAGQPILPQVKAFAALAGKLAPGEFTICDLEEGNGPQLARAKAWFDEADATLTYPGYHGGWLYSGESFFHTAGLMPIADSPRHSWVAAYGHAEPADVPHSLWQHTNGQLADTHCQPWPHVGHVDCSIFHGSAADFRAKVFTQGAPQINPSPHQWPVGPHPVMHQVKATDGGLAGIARMYPGLTVKTLLKINAYAPWRGRNLRVGDQVEVRTG